MTRLQQETTRSLLASEFAWLESYGWLRVLPGCRVSHPKAPTLKADYSVRDAVAFTRAEPLRYG